MQTYIPPPVLMDEITAEVLYSLARTAPGDSRQTAELLLDEIERADILPSNQLPPKIVRIGSDVTYRNVQTGQVRSGAIVLPNAADISEGRISVLSPVGAALIGLAEKSSIRWRIGKREIELQVLKVGRFSSEALCN
jgi:regulator of nucleoside diphosphate kinase